MDEHTQKPDSEAVHLLQSRLGRFARVTGLAGLSLAVFWLGLAFTFDRSLENVSWPALAFHTAGSLVFLGIAVFSRKPSPSLSYIHTLETTGLLLACASFILAGDRKSVV